MAPNQTAATLSSACWYFLSYYQDTAGFLLLQPETARQESQTALLVSGPDGSSGFLLWEVFFDDEEGRRLYLYVDDETGQVLGLHFCPVESTGDEELWSHVAAELLAQYLDLWIDDSDATEYAAYLEQLFELEYYAPSDKSAVTGERADIRPVYEGEVPAFTVLNEDGERCAFLIDYGEAWFRININR